LEAGQPRDDDADHGDEQRPPQRAQDTGVVAFRATAVVNAQRQVEGGGDERQADQQPQEQRQRVQVEPQGRAEEAVDERR
jgi:hypothetical protein